MRSPSCSTRSTTPRWRCRVADTPPVLLASGSPRRRELLAQLGCTFTVLPPDVDESVQAGESPTAYVDRLAVEKAHAVEADPTMVYHLKQSLLPRWPQTFHLTEGDAVEKPLADLVAPADGSFKVVANLPYAISTPWMDAVLSGPLPSRMVLMLQQEAAQRYAASPGGNARGGSILTDASAASWAVGSAPVINGGMRIYVAARAASVLEQVLRAIAEFSLLAAAPFAAVGVLIVMRGFPAAEDPS